MDKKVRKELVMQNNYMCKYGPLKQLQLVKPIKNYYNHEFYINVSTNFSDVYVKPIHSLALAKEFVKNGLNPVIVSTVSKEFDGNNIDNSNGLHDYIINVKTNFATSVVSNMYPLKHTEVIYTKYIHVIRDDTLQINSNDIFRTSLIMANPIQDPVLVDTTMNLNNYFETKELIETIFQTAQTGGHDVIIFGDFGCKHTNCPVNELVDIFNMMILKYGYYFKFVIFGIPVMDASDAAINAYFNKEIVKPQNLGTSREVEIANDIDNSHTN